MQPHSGNRPPRWSPRQIWLQLTDPPSALQRPERRQVRLLAGILIALIGLGLLAAIIPNVIAPKGPILENSGFIATLVIAGILFAAYVMNRRGNYSAAAGITIGILSFGFFVDAISGRNLSNIVSLYYLVLPVLLASALLSLRDTFILFIVHVIGILLLPFVSPQFTHAVLATPLTFNIILSTVVLLKSQYRDLLEKDRQAWLNAVLRELPAGITVQAPDGRLIYANDRAAEIVGFSSAGELLNTTAAEFMRRFQVFDEAGQSFDVSQMPGRKALQGIPGQEMVLRFTVPTTKEQHWLLVRATPIVGDTGRIESAVNTYQDITRLKLTESAQRFLAQASKALGSSLDYQTTLKTVANLAVPTIADWCAIDILEDGVVKRLVVTHPDQKNLENILEAAKRYPPDPNAATGVPNVIRTAKSELYEDIPQSMLRAAAIDDEHWRLIEMIGFSSAMIVPLIAHGNVLGAITFVTAESGRHYDRSDLELAEELARRAGLAMDNAQLYQNMSLERERFEVTLSSIGDAVIATDTNSVVTFINPVAERLTGWNRSDAINKKLTDIFNIINEYTRQLVEDPTQRVLTEGVVVGLANHTLLIGRDGMEHPIDDSGAPIKDVAGTLRGAVLVFRDITERKQAEFEQSFLSQLSAALASSLDYEQTVKSIARLIVPLVADWCNVYMLADDGYSIKHLIVAHSDPATEERVHQILINTSFNLESDYPVAEALRTGQVQLVTEIPEERYQQLASDQFARSALRDLKITSSLCIPLVARGRKLGVLTLNMAESGRALGAQNIPFAEEVGRRAALAIDNARLYAEVQQTVRFRDEFLSIAAHELRTPVTSIRGFAQLLIRRFEKSETLDMAAVQRAMKVMNEQTHKLTRLISQLLDISRIQLGTLSLDKQVTDLTALVESVANSAQMGTDQHTIEVKAEPSISALVDPIRIEQVLWNLLDNAIKYSPEGGPIQVELTTPVPDKVEISVTDHGLGIPTEHQDRIFERSYQAHPDRRLGGLGLGLYISRQIVEQHGGTIRHEPVPGGGTRFITRLPR